MKMSLLILSLAATAVCHAQDTKAWPDACGKDAVQFKVKTEKVNAANAAPEAGKAMIVFVENLDGDFSSAPTIRFALDGSWVGAGKGKSYVAVPVESGTHHLCASRQSSIHDEKMNVGVVTLNPEAGNVYFYEFTIKRTEIGDASLQGGNSVPGRVGGSMAAKSRPTVDTVDFRALSVSEGQTLQRKLPVSVFTQK